MNVLIIIIGLLTERYWIHGFPTKRFSWFMSYFKLQKNNTKILTAFFKKHKVQFANKLNAENPWLMLFMITMPPILITVIILSTLSGVFFGFFRFVLELTLFCYLLGPENIFSIKKERNLDISASTYLFAITQQIVAIVVYYALLGPEAALFYRLVFLIEENGLLKNSLQQLMDVLDWLPTRMTAFLSIMVGNFQKSIGFFMKHVLDKRITNQDFLQQILNYTLLPNLDEAQALKNAQKLVEYAFIMTLVIMALTSLLS